ncbi:hypothetical protein BS47DRAFT_1369504 [Hydnum rufescens UP504]|uniref:Uncharacterized protein n=1 Tax=Hydnum rufescens UP504 TaxID=1448309 RepID=A0A9P6DLR2_9AGAM|nr:hypothetical protein BS47DRAFT_1369504 [Hydnum rufescens UP504]
MLCERTIFPDIAGKRFFSTDGYDNINVEERRIERKVREVEGNDGMQEMAEEGSNELAVWGNGLICPSGDLAIWSDIIVPPRHWAKVLTEKPKQYPLPEHCARYSAISIASHTGSVMEPGSSFRARWSRLSASLSDPAHEQDLPKSEDSSGLVICVKYDELRNTKKVKNIFSPRQPGAKGWAPKGENPLPLGCSQFIFIVADMDKDKCGAVAKADNPDLACHPEMWIAYPRAVKSQLTPYFSPIMILYRFMMAVSWISVPYMPLWVPILPLNMRFQCRDPRSTEWRALHIQHLHILIQHLPDVSTIASQGDYLGSYVPQSYEEWQQVFGIDNFGDFLIDDLKFGPAFKDFAKQAFGIDTKLKRHLPCSLWAILRVFGKSHAQYQL